MKNRSIKMIGIFVSLFLLLSIFIPACGIECTDIEGTTASINTSPRDNSSEPNQNPVAIIGEYITGFKGTYYNLPSDHPDIEGEITGVVEGDNPFNHDWFDDKYFSFERTDHNLTFGKDFFPVDDGLDGDPQYFSVHWQANISVPEDGEYSFLMGSDDDSWLYIDDTMVIDLGGVHALEEDIGSVNLTAGTHSLDIYFAERHLVQSGFYFEFLDQSIEIVSTIIWEDIIAEVNEIILLKGSCSYDSDGSIISYEWDFGDGTTGMDTNPEHVYSNSGTYIVTLTVTDDEAAIDTDTCTIIITNKPPVAEVEPEYQIVTTIQETVIFYGNASYDEDGTIITYYWNFGDGTTGMDANPEHVYSNSGTYIVTLTVTDDEGATDNDTCIITIINQPPVAEAGDDKTVFLGETVNFDSSNSYDFGGEIVQYKWDFGDGELGEGITAEHEYLSKGNYTVTLTIIDNENASNSDTCIISVLKKATLEYELEYINPVDKTIVNENGISFYTTGKNPGKYYFVPFNETYILPSEDYGIYALYNRCMYFKIYITNPNGVTLNNVRIKATQEYHNTVTVLDNYGEIDLQKGTPLGGSPTTNWLIEVKPGVTELEGFYYITGRGWGLDQTHLTISIGDTIIIDNPEAGVYCPP